MPHLLPEITITNATVRLIAPAMIEIIIHDFADIEESDIIEMKQASFQLFSAKPVVFLFSPGMMSSSSENARIYFSKFGTNGEAKAKALVIKSLGHKLVANLDAYVNKPAIPTRFFEERQEAIDWLNKMLS